MHELSIAENLIELAVQAAASANATHVDVVHLRLGALAGVDKEALLFGYSIAVTGTLLDGSRLEIEDSPVVVKCSACGSVSTLKNPQSLCCPLCGTPTGDVRQGREIELVSVEIHDD